MNGALDFQGLNERLLARCPGILQDWFPAGRIVGGWFVLGNIQGDRGDSLAVSLSKGIWIDHAAGDGQYRDLVSLYAAYKGLSAGDAYRALGGDSGPQRANSERPLPTLVRKKAAPPPKVDFPRPPADHVVPARIDYRTPKTVWQIRDVDGSLIHLVVRYEDEKGNKTYAPYCWDAEADCWKAGGPPGLRPLYNLPALANPDTPVLIVEGEKCAEAAAAKSAYACITWTGGAAAWSRADWSPVYGRRVVVWPDADEPGQRCAQAIAGMLKDHCPSVSLVDVSDQRAKWDIADANFRSPREMYAFMRPRIRPYEAASVSALPPPEEYSSISQAITSLNLECTEKGIPHANLANVAKVLRGHPNTAGRLYTDSFAERTFFADGDVPTEVTDTLILSWQQWMQVDVGLTRVSKDAVADAVTLVGSEQSFNPVTDYLDSLEWDGVRRLDHWLHETVGAPFDDYHIAVSRNFWVGLVARALSPGCQMDNMMVLWGKGGWKKTSLFRTIGGDWYMEMTDSVDSKDFFVSLAGKLVVEISEMDSFSKSDVSRVKQIITMRSDRYRVPYGMRSEDHPRKAVFVGTTNDPHFLKDSTGNRRFLPVEVLHEIDCSAVASARDQLFAEAVDAFKQGEAWWNYPEEETAAIQEASRQDDPWESIIKSMLAGRMLVSVDEIFEELKIEAKDRKAADGARINRILRMLGWSQGKKKSWTRGQ